MLVSRRAVFIGLAGLATVLLGCRRPPDVTAEPSQPPERWLTTCVAAARDAPIARSERLPLPPRPGAPADEVRAAAARMVPGGWGGIDDDGSGRTLVRLVDTTRAEEAVVVLRQLSRDAAWSRLSLPSLARTRVVPARWSFAQLYDWMEYLDRELRWAREPEHGRSHLARMDEDENAVLFTATDSAMLRWMEDALAARDLPCGLVRTSCVGPAWLVGRR